MYYVLYLYYICSVFCVLDKWKTLEKLWIDLSVYVNECKRDRERANERDRTKGTNVMLRDLGTFNLIHIIHICVRNTYFS